jgi:hypothetical protein
MPEVAVHGQGTSQEGRASAPPPQTGLPLPVDQGHGAGDVPRGFATQVGSSRVPDPRPATPQAGPLLRCNNCGTLGHLPRACPNYGWYYPAPGKSREDYVEDRQRVQDLIAADIINEHAAHEDDDGSILFKDARPGPAHKALALQVTCPGCGQGPGEKCQTGAGKPCELHKRRLDAVDSPPPGR